MSGSQTFPPSGPTNMQLLGPFAAYVYKEYSDDVNIQAFFVSFNQIAQAYLNLFNTLNLPVYTKLSGPLLDWVAEGLYGIFRPSLPEGSLTTIGPFATAQFATIQFAATVTEGSIINFVTTDDIFQRLITWQFFKGDGMQFSIQWLKRRVKRFLIGTNGTAPNIDNTYDISVAFGSSNLVTITVTLSPGTPIQLSTAQVLQAAIANGAAPLPFQFDFSLVIVNDLANTGLTNVNNVLNVTNTTGWPTSPSGLADGSVWDNGGVVNVVAGVTPNPDAPPLIFGTVTSAQLLSLGGGNLPLADPVNAGQLWNNDGVVNISVGN